MWNVIFLVTGLIFLVLLLTIFFSKEIIPSQENKYFKSLIIANLIGYLFEIPLQIVVMYTLPLQTLMFLLPLVIRQ